MRITYDTVKWDKRVSELARDFPAFRVRLLSKVGSHGRVTMKGVLMQGDDVFHLLSFPYGESGKKRTVSSKVFRRGNAVRMNSFPVNLYNKGRKLRSGERQQPTLVFDRFVQLMKSRELQRGVDQAEKEILEKEFSKV